MNTAGLQQLKRWVLLLATPTIWACGDAVPVGPGPARGGFGAEDSGSAVLDKKPDLGDCDSLRVPKHNKLVLRAAATGVQIYQWSGTTWTFVAPQATLFTDDKKHEVVATHFAGPTWQSTDGSKVVAAAAKRCPADPNSIPWLLLQTVSTTGPGIFESVTFVQRLHTVGGNAPATPGTTVGQIANVPYTAQYFFYRAK